MKARPTALALVLSLFFLAPMHVASATTVKDKDAGLSVPVSGTFTDAAGQPGKFSGTFNITHFAAENNRLVAVGTIAGTFTDSQRKVVATGLQTVSVPVTAAGGGAGTAAQPITGRAVTFTKASSVV